MRPARSLLAPIALLALTVAATARADLAEFDLSGAVTTISSNGDPSFLEQMTALGVVPGAPLEAVLVYDLDTPATSPGFYEHAIRFVRVRIGGYELRGPTFASPFADATVSLSLDGPVIFGAGSADMGDTPDILRPEDVNRAHVLGFSIEGEPFFDSLDLPSELPDPADGSHQASGRFFGGDALAGRFSILFDIHSIRPADAGTPGRRDLEPLLAYRQGRNRIVVRVFSGGCTQKDDFAVDAEEVDGVLRIGLRRRVPDPCRAVVPGGERIFFRLRELGIQPGQRFQVVNPLAIGEAPPRRRDRE